MAVSGVTPSSSSSAVPSIDLLSSFTKALKQKKRPWFKKKKKTVGCFNNYKVILKYDLFSHSCLSQWCFSHHAERVNLQTMLIEQLHFPATRCLTEWEKPVDGVPALTQAIMSMKLLNLKFHRFNRAPTYSALPFVHHREFHRRWVAPPPYDTFSTPDGLWVDVDWGNAFEQELNHLQERIGRLFGKR